MKKYQEKSLAKTNHKLVLQEQEGAFNNSITYLNLLTWTSILAKTSPKLYLELWPSLTLIQWMNS